MRNRKWALGIGLFVVCAIGGALIPIGSGSGLVLGGLVGLVLCYLVVTQKRFWSTPAEDNTEPDQRAIQEKTQGIREAHVNDSIVMDQLRHTHN